jgi:hypothetical protein
MNTVFAINFRREAFQREQAKTRRRAMVLGLWVLYFGALGIVVGLYALNTSTLGQRVAIVERQVERLRKRPAGETWRPGQAEALAITQHLRDPRQWRDRLTRLPQVLPPNALLRSLEFNPDNVSGNADVKLVITGELRAGAGQDRVQLVMGFVNQLSRDTVFASGYRNVRLVSTRALSEGNGAEFVVECR